jgi:hypothetical protein
VVVLLLMQRLRVDADEGPVHRPFVLRANQNSRLSLSGTGEIGKSRGGKRGGVPRGGAGGQRSTARRGPGRRRPRRRRRRRGARGRPCVGGARRGARVLGWLVQRGGVRGELGIRSGRSRGRGGEREGGCSTPYKLSRGGGRQSSWVM